MGCGVSEVPEGERTGVIELLGCCLLEGSCLVGDSGLVQPFFLVLDCLFCGFQDSVKPSDHRHGQNHVPVLPTDVEVSEDAVGYVPDEVGDLGKLAVLHSRRTPRVIRNWLRVFAAHILHHQVSTRGSGRRLLLNVSHVVVLALPVSVVLVAAYLAPGLVGNSGVWAGFA